MSEWTKPSFIEIDMSAEIGGYQGDDPSRDVPDHMPDFVEPAATTDRS
jgi:coenzyme PQQ precursor peptide PqqA